MSMRSKINKYKLSRFVVDIILALSRYAIIRVKTKKNCNRFVVDLRSKIKRTQHSRFVVDIIPGLSSMLRADSYSSEDESKRALHDFERSVSIFLFFVFVFFYSIFF